MSDCSSLPVSLLNRNDTQVATRTTAEFVKGISSQYVKLNVGGCLFYTTIGTLTKYDSMLRAMFSGRMEVLTDSEKWVLIDRCGQHFSTILNFLRDGTVVLPDKSRELRELLTEAKYYLIQELIDLIEAQLSRIRESQPECITRVPLIRSSKEESLLLLSSPKPAVKLLINRHNNKYSYTCSSDDNLLKNLELFDKLCLRFSTRVLFVKQVMTGNEICCWSFYGQGKRVAEVSTSSIVYATDKKHTKVEFPEARIYEETLNILLYEQNTTPPHALDMTDHVKDEADDEEDEDVDDVRRASNSLSVSQASSSASTSTTRFSRLRK